MPSWSQTETLVVDISADTTHTNSVHVGGFERGSVLIPAAFTSTTIKFEVSNDDTTWDVARDDNDADLGTKTVAVDKIYNVPAEVFKSKFARILTGSAELADRNLVVNFGGN